MKRFFDVYIRAAAAAIDPTDIAAGVNILDGFDRLELLDAGAKIISEPVEYALGDGTTISDGEKFSFECGTLRVDKAEWLYLRGAFDNKKCDVLFYDPSDNTLLVAAYRLQVAVTLLATSGETMLIKLTGTRNMSNAGGTDTILLMAPGVTVDTALVTGYVYAENGTTPVAGVLVHLEDGSANEYEDTTDVDGAYLIALKAGVEYTYTLTKSGGWAWAADVTVTPTKDSETDIDFTATTNGS
jgi:hypothetical protein